MILPFSPRLRRCGARGAFATVVALALSPGCSDRSRNAAEARNGGGAAPVVVGRAEMKVVPLVVDAIGTVEPIHSAAVRAQITGTLLKIDIREGQDVAAGDLLFEVDPRPFETALRSALADQQRTHVQLATARSQVERYKALPVGAMISQEQLEQVEDTARSLEAAAAAAEAAVASARLQLGYCSIRAPIAGRTGNLNVHVGDLIRANDTGDLVTINQLSPIYVTFAVAQQHLPAILRYRSTGALRVAVAAGAGEPVLGRGELTFLDNTVDPATGTIKLKATCPNPDHRLWPGQFLTVTTTLAAPTVLTVPASAVQTDQSGRHVFVVRPDHTAEFRPVVIERTEGNDAVVTRGVAAGEIVVTDGQLRVVSGGPVQVKPAAPAGDDPPEGVAKEDASRPRPAARAGKQGS